MSRSRRAVVVRKAGSVKRTPTFANIYERLLCFSLSGLSMVA